MCHCCLVIEKRLQVFSLPFASDKDAKELQQLKNIKLINQQTVHQIFIFINFLTSTIRSSLDHNSALLLYGLLDRF